MRPLVRVFSLLMRGNNCARAAGKGPKSENSQLDDTSRPREVDEALRGAREGQIPGYVKPEEQQPFRLIDSDIVLASRVSHEFGNLIQGVAACLDLALRQLDPSTKASEYVSQARVALRRGEAMTKQLNASGRKANAPSPLSLDGELEQLTAIMESTVGPNVELRMDTAAPESLILAHPFQVQQLLLNLLSNARDAIPEAGCVTIRTRRERVGESSKWRIRLEVTDTGRGMDGVTRSRMFEPFFTTKPRDKGSGLGLSIVLAIARELDAELLVGSAVGLGTTCVVSFPEVQKRNSPRERGEATVEPRQSVSRTTGVFSRGPCPLTR